MHLQKESRSFLQKLLQSPPLLPFEPALLPMLFEVTQENSTASTDDVAKLIGRSQKLAVRVLATANSAAYGLEVEVSTLLRAISVLGVQEVRIIAVMVGMASVMQGSKLPEGFCITTLWKHHLSVAAIAKALAAQLGGPSGRCGPRAPEDTRLSMAPDEAYVAGLLHDIGKVFFAASRPDLWEDVDASWKKDCQQYFEAENAYWGMDHALIGAEVLHFWKLPLLLTEPINWHHTPELASAFKMEARLLAAANYIARSEFDVEGALCPEAAALLPEGSDTAALRAAVAEGLAAISIEPLETL